MLKTKLVQAANMLAVLAIAIALLSARAAIADSSPVFSSPAVTAKLISAQDGISQGASTLSAGLDLELGEGWKTYWRSPGEVGLPPRMDWSGSSNVANVEVLWPAPVRFTAFGIENFGYDGEVVIPLQIQLERPGEPATLSVEVTLLICSKVCVPQNFNLSLFLPRGTGIDHDAAARIGAFAERVPLEGDAANINSAKAQLDDRITKLTVQILSNAPFNTPDIFPELGVGTALGKPDIRLGDGGRTLWAQFPVLAVDDTTFHTPILTVTDGPGRAITVTPDLSEVALVPPFNLEQLAPGMAQLAWIVVVAFLGGMILNVMPCVLPVLSIKLSSALKQQGRSQMAVRGGFLAAAAGVMVFMWGLAATLFILKRFGVMVGWGLQFQNPVFLALMFVILSVFSANLVGLFQINLPSRLQTRLSNAGRGHGYGSDFLTGLFGAVMATPCTAPFLGTAIAFAFAGRPVDLLVVFTSLGLGLATPYLVVATSPRLVTLLPKPGRWMIGLKLALGALLIITALWLLWVLIGVAGITVAIVVASLSAILIFVLSWNQSATLRWWWAIAVFATLPLFAAGWLAQPDPAQSQTIAQDWTIFNRAEIAQLVSRGEVVFVDVTANWCLTCKANKALVLDREPALAALRADDVTLMQADWTRPDEAIARYLESFNRFGIPFNVVYGPAAPDGIVLSEVLSTTAVIQALEDARLSAQVTRSSN